MSDLSLFLNTGAAVFIGLLATQSSGEVLVLNAALSALNAGLAARNLGARLTKRTCDETSN